MKSSSIFSFNFIVAVLTVGFSSAAMAEKSQSISQKMLKPVIEYQCGQELNASKVWKGASMFMSAAQKKDNQTAICQCVSEHAMDEMTAKDLMIAAVSESEKNKLISKAVLNSLRGCVQQALN